MILGADIYGDLILSGIRHGRSNEPVARKMALGWVLTGSIRPCHGEGLVSSRIFHCSMIENNISLSKELRRFLEFEETPFAPAVSVEDEICESLFASEHHRLPNGRYSVPLPRRSIMSSEKLGDTLSIARKSLDIVRRRMSRDNAFREQYEAFMSQYESHRYMKYLAKGTSCSQGYSVSIPHHAVWQASDRGKKLRVVFDASRRLPSGEALNKLLLPGPSLQTDLLSVILGWRRHKIVFSAYIKMIYRQILVRPEDMDLQRILWQQSEDPEPKHYRLLTLTYGMNCAPYLALRTLAQLARDEGPRFPKAAHVLLQDTYENNSLQCSMLDVSLWESGSRIILSSSMTSRHRIASVQSGATSRLAAQSGLWRSPGIQLETPSVFDALRSKSAALVRRDRSWPL